MSTRTFIRAWDDEFAYAVEVPIRVGSRALALGPDQATRTYWRAGLTRAKLG